MAKIKLEDIKREAAQHGWLVISDIYHNLNENMIFECDKGHQINLPYKKVRDKFICPICKEFDGTTKIEYNNQIPEKGNQKRILALDQSSKTTGYAIFDDEILIYYNIVKFTDKVATIRFIKLRNWLEQMIELWRPDCVLLEDIQLQGDEKDGEKDSNTFKILAENLGVLEVLLTECGVSYEVIHTSTWRNTEQITGRNRTERKTQGQERVRKCYHIDVTDDVSDAILIGRHYLLRDKKIEIQYWGI